MTIDNNFVGTSTQQGIRCDECGSYEIDNSSGEYVCRICGLVQNIQRFDYNKPFKQEKVQHEVISDTQIGFRYERMRFKKFKRLNKIHTTKTSSESILRDVKFEVNRILNKLNLPISHSFAIHKKTKEIRDVLNPGTKYRNPDRLVPIVIYVYMKYNKIAINKKNLLEISKISKKEFNSFLTTILKFFPKYDEENKLNYIKQKIMRVSEDFNLPMGFYFLSKEILYKFWDIIKNTKEDVIAGLVCSISALCDYQDEISVNRICKKVNIQMSTVQARVERHFFERYNVPGFESLVKSADLLKKIMVKLGIRVNSVDLEDKEEPSEVGCSKRAKKKKPKESTTYPEEIMIKIRKHVKKYNTLKKIQANLSIMKKIANPQNSPLSSLEDSSLQFKHTGINRMLNPLKLERLKFHEFNDIKGPPKL
ncbi:MAG: hypothetical protein BAJALOKI2v1_540017 [Promethearchaeota archaeon]|nr:MAG: hypothetical protein BAJALOKI2v1_540017 [Candidatus Lokiarchaeota archaeon]